ncbi:MAG: GNAT family N-acetyltransferase [Chloroflexi bacterium]|nr:GNAT family N-acetyltransferase [Chloroflexota bacterium]
MKPSIRLATKEDIPFLVESRIAFFNELWGEPLTEAQQAEARQLLPAQFEHALGETLFCFLVEVGNKPVSMGCLATQQKLYHPNLPKGRAGKLLNFYTPPQHRREGHARLLMGHIIEFAKTHQIGAISLNATSMAKELYKDAGFIPDPAQIHLPMTLKLDEDGQTVN